MALHSMVMMASAAGRLLPTRAIAQQLRASEAHVSKVLQRLSKAGLVSSTRGRNGGSTLARDAASVTLIDVFQAMEGHFNPQTCLFDQAVCTEGSCILGTFLQSMNSQFVEYMSQTTLAEAVARLPAAMSQASAVPTETS